jgi:ATP-binding cassette, subfamily B, multidrug efflux pump
LREIFQLFVYVKPYWRKSLFALFLLIVVVLLDLAIPRLVQQLIDLGITGQDLQVVLRTFFIMLGISVLNTLFAVGNNNYSVQVGESVARDLREALFLKIQSFSYANLDQQKTGQLIVRLTSDVNVFQRLVQISLRIGTRAPLIMIGSLILMFNTSRSLALTILPLLIFTSVIIVFFIIKMGPLFLSMQQRLDRLNTILQENISGVRVVKAFVRAENETQRFEVGNEAYTEYNVRVMQFLSTMGPILSACVSIGIVVVIWAGGLQSMEGDLTTGQIVAFVNYLQTTIGPLLIMVNLANIWAAGIASSARIREVLETVSDIQDDENAELLPKLTRPKVVFENVTFHYNHSDDNAVLEGVNLVAEPGEMVAILGATGAGKTSLVNLIPRFYDPDNGRVLINGVDIRKVQQKSLLAQIGIVPQETVLFSGSVRDNICFGRPDASDDEIFAAAKAAQAHEFIMNLPQGYDTHVEERGVNLSGGQKQRIAIARALLIHPAILILDDSTSSVDVETESKIQAALDHWMKDRTSFVVAQRISTVLKADRILVIEKGRVAAEGNHSQLLRTSPIYQEIYASQLGNGTNGA